MNDMTNHVEVAVKRKLDSELMVKKILLILLYIVFTLGFFGLFFYIKFVQICALLPVFVWMLVFFTWRYTDVEYEYIVSSGEISVAAIYGNRVRKKMLEMKISEIERIAPYDDAEKEKLAGMEIKNVYNILREKDSPDAYFALFDLPKKGRSVLLFEKDERALKVMRFYNARTVIRS